METPDWLDVDFLYRINYGPGTAQDVARAKEILDQVKDRKHRESITLLDRTIALKLHEALFATSGWRRLFKVDWVGVEADARKSDEIEKPTDGRISPFDYLPLKHEGDPLLGWEELP